MKAKDLYNVAVYLRLSKDDGEAGKAESNSISNQKELIRDFLKDKEDIVVVSERVDDGYSGSSFERPSFKLMMEDIKKGVEYLQKAGSNEEAKKELLKYKKTLFGKWVRR